MSLGAQLTLGLWLLASPIWIPLVAGGAALAAVVAVGGARSGLLWVSTRLLDVSQWSINSRRAGRWAPRWIFAGTHARGELVRHHEPAAGPAAGRDPDHAREDLARDRLPGPLTPPLLWMTVAVPVVDWGWERFPGVSACPDRIRELEFLAGLGVARIVLIRP